MRRMASIFAGVWRNGSCVGEGRVITAGEVENTTPVGNAGLSDGEKVPFVSGEAPSVDGEAPFDGISSGDGAASVGSFTASDCDEVTPFVDDEEANVALTASADTDVSVDGVAPCVEGSAMTPISFVV